jgi:hypothetical protein
LSRPTRRIVRTPSFERGLNEARSSAGDRLDEALTGFEHVVARIPESGMAVPGRSGFRSRPFHSSEGSYLVVYTYDREKVVFLSIRRVPSGSFGER